MDQSEFLQRYKIESDAFETAGIDWQNLLEIMYHYEELSAELKHAVQIYSNMLQTVPGIHSTRWRIKDAEHLIEKIIRKKISSNEKYSDINTDNYSEIVTDLIGIRALHLFKDDILGIHPVIKEMFELDEEPVAYVRQGDETEIYDACNLKHKSHPSSYRSIHYVFKTRPMKREIRFELQLRTIFEEGWSEIDHSVRYPNHSDDKVIGGILAIFNRISGAADEFGSITKIVADEISQHKKANEKSLNEMKAIVEELSTKKNENNRMSAELDKMRAELGKFEKRTTLSDLGDVPRLSYIQQIMNEQVRQQKNQREVIARAKAALIKHSSPDKKQD